METYFGYVKTLRDAVLLIEACCQRRLERVQHRMSEQERRLVRSGTVFVWDERETGMRRWTDGRNWSSSRVISGFLTYNEVVTRRERRPDSNDTRLISRRRIDLLPHGLTKRALIVTTRSGHQWHMVSYFCEDDVAGGQLRVPSDDPQFYGLELPHNVYPSRLLLPPGLPGELSTTTDRRRKNRSTMTTSSQESPRSGESVPTTAAPHQVVSAGTPPTFIPSSYHPSTRHSLHPPLPPASYAVPHPAPLQSHHQPSSGAMADRPPMGHVPPQTQQSLVVRLPGARRASVVAYSAPAPPVRVDTAEWTRVPVSYAYRPPTVSNGEYHTAYETAILPPLLPSASLRTTFPPHPHPPQKQQPAHPSQRVTAAYHHMHHGKQLAEERDCVSNIPAHNALPSSPAPYWHHYPYPPSYHSSSAFHGSAQYNRPEYPQYAYAPYTAGASNVYATAEVIPAGPSNFGNVRSHPHSSAASTGPAMPRLLQQYCPPISAAATAAAAAAAVHSATHTPTSSVEMCVQDNRVSDKALLPLVGKIAGSRSHTRLPLPPPLLYGTPFKVVTRCADSGDRKVNTSKHRPVSRGGRYSPYAVPAKLSPMASMAVPCHALADTLMVGEDRQKTRCDGVLASLGDHSHTTDLARQTAVAAPATPPTSVSPLVSSHASSLHTFNGAALAVSSSVLESPVDSPHIAAVNAAANGGAFWTPPARTRLTP